MPSSLHTRTSVVRFRRSRPAASRSTPRARPLQWLVSKATPLPRQIRRPCCRKPDDGHLRAPTGDDGPPGTTSGTASLPASAASPRRRSQQRRGVRVRDANGDPPQSTSSSVLRLRCGCTRSRRTSRSSRTESRCSRKASGCPWRAVCSSGSASAFSARARTRLRPSSWGLRGGTRC